MEIISLHLPRINVIGLRQGLQTTARGPNPTREGILSITKMNLFAKNL